MPFENNRSIPTDQELRTDHNDQLKDNRSKQEAFLCRVNNKGTLKPIAFQPEASRNSNPAPKMATTMKSLSDRSHWSEPVDHH